MTSIAMTRVEDRVGSKDWDHHSQSYSQSHRYSTTIPTTQLYFFPPLPRPLPRAEFLPRPPPAVPLSLANSHFLLCLPLSFSLTFFRSALLSYAR